MKQLIIQKLFLNSSLGRAAFLAGGILWGLLLIPAAYLILNIQLSNINSIEGERRNSIQEVLAETFSTYSRYGDLVNARGLVIKIGKPLGLNDLGVCINGKDAIPRVFEDRCQKNVSKETEVQIENSVTLRFYWSNYKINWKQIIFKTILSSLLLSLLMLFLTSAFYYYIIKKRIHFLSQKISAENAEETNPLETFSIPEMQPVVHALKNYRNSIKLYHEEKQRLEGLAIFASVAKQVAHDIRSPLSALNMLIGHYKNIPEEQKEIIQQVVLRINGIADDLLNESKNTSRPSAVTSTTTKTEQNYKILPALKTLITEKNLEFKDIPGVDVVPRFNNTPEEVEVAIPDKSIQRILSNLINNSVEAITDNGMIFIEVQVKAQTLIISVIDFGKGIPPDVLEKLNRKEFLSHGKEHSKKSGSGIGLESAYSDLQKVGGNLKIESKLEVGTRVTIELPITNSVN